MSITPITPGESNPDPGEPDLGAIDEAFERVFGTPPDAPVVDLAAGESIVDPAPSDDTQSSQVPREEGEGGGGVSPVATPPAAPAAPSGATDFTPPSDAPASEPPVIVDDSTGDPAVRPVGADDPTPPPVATAPATPPAPPVDEIDMNTLFTGWLGRPPTVEEGRALIGLVDDLQSGRVQLTPAGQVIQTPPTSTPAPTPTPSATPPSLDDDWDTPPATVPPEVQAQLDEMRQWREQQEYAQRQQWEQWVAGEQAAAAEEFRNSAPITLSPEELIVLERRAASSGEFALAMNQTGNPRTSWTTALERVLYTDPAYRDRIIDAQVQARAAENAEAAERARRAASVSAGGGAVGGTPSPNRPTNSPMTIADAKEAATRDMAAFFAQGQPDS